MWSSVGYLRIPQGLQALESGRPDAALEHFEEVAAVADRSATRISRPSAGWVVASRGSLGEVAARLPAARRGHARRHLRRGVGRGRGHRLLRDDRGVPPRSSTCDGRRSGRGAQRLVRAPARPRPVPRPVPPVPRRAHADPRRLAERRRGVAAGRGAAHRAAARPGRRRGALPAGGAGSAPRVARGRGARVRARGAGSGRRPEPGWRSCAWRRVGWTRRRGSGGPSRRRRRTRPRLAATRVEIALAAGDVAGREHGRRPLLGVAATPAPRRCCARWPPRPTAPCAWPRPATPGASAACARRRPAGTRGGALRGRPGPGADRATRATRSATRTRPRWSAAARQGSRASAQARCSRRSTARRAARPRRGWAERPRGRGPRARRRRPDEPRDRRRAGDQRADGRPPREQLYTKLDVSTRAGATALATSIA